MKESKPLPAVRDFIEGMWAILPVVIHDHPGMLLSRDFLNHFLEETDDAVFGHVTPLNDTRWLNQSLTRRVIFEDGINRGTHLH